MLTDNRPYRPCLLYGIKHHGGQVEQSQLARDVGMSRQGLDKALSGDGNPSLATVVKVAQALGLRLSFKAMHAGQSA
jgi:DNA-binding phage protein